VGAGGFKVDVVGAGGGDQDQLELRAGGQGAALSRILLLIATLAPCRRSMTLSGVVSRTAAVAEACAGAEVKIAEVQRRVIKEDGAASIRHQLYLLCCE
jgi:hypothetical protein